MKLFPLTSSAATERKLHLQLVGAIWQALSMEAEWRWSGEKRMWMDVKCHLHPPNNETAHQPGPHIPLPSLLSTIPLGTSLCCWSRESPCLSGSRSVDLNLRASCRQTLGTLRVHHGFLVSSWKDPSSLPLTGTADRSFTEIPENVCSFQVSLRDTTSSHQADWGCQWQLPWPWTSLTWSS